MRVRRGTRCAKKSQFCSVLLYKMTAILFPQPFDWDLFEVMINDNRKRSW